MRWMTRSAACRRREVGHETPDEPGRTDGDARHEEGVDDDEHHAERMHAELVADESEHGFPCRRGR